jgi:hypothetical protein
MKQIEIGIDVESEHENSYKWIEAYLRRFKKLPTKEEFFKHIAIDHLEEHADYYTRLIKAGL